MKYSLEEQKRYEEYRVLTGIPLKLPDMVNMAEQIYHDGPEYELDNDDRLIRSLIFPICVSCKAAKQHPDVIMCSTFLSIAIMSDDPIPDYIVPYTGEVEVGTPHADKLRRVSEYNPIKAVKIAVIELLELRRIATENLPADAPIIEGFKGLLVQQKLAIEAAISGVEPEDVDDLREFMRRHFSE